VEVSINESVDEARRCGAAAAVLDKPY